jgi:hypothetical protein
MAGSETTRGAYAHIVGNGTSTSNRSNAHTLDWEGNAWFAGDVYVDSTSGRYKDKGSKKLATESYIDSAIAAIPQADWNVNDENDPAYIQNRPFYEIKGDWVLVSDEFERPMIKIPIATDVTEGLSKAGMYRFTVNEKDTYIYHKEQDGIIANDILIEATNSNGLPFGIVVFNGS